ncbi:endonuclease VII domain-containing protein [Streptomyces sp. NPDC008222]|uniref:endonuclease VII domain-containing protein n=1 Tax=Streptomyces sp. NPDC008222 TaxID=3364820 RepID=UPI0036F0A803
MSRRRSAAGGAARSSRTQPSPSSGRTSTACGAAAAQTRLHRVSSVGGPWAGRFRRPRLSCKPTRTARAAEQPSRAVRRDRLIASQGGVCGVCSAAPATQVDHCHQTGRVRGVLCFNCNSGLGLLGDNPEAMYRAADYLEGNAWKPTLVAPGVYRPPS